MQGNLLITLRKTLLLLVVFLIPYQNVSIFGNPYLYLPMVAFLTYFPFVIISQPVKIIRNKRTFLLLFPMILLWLLVAAVNFINYTRSDQSPLVVSYLQRFFSFMVFFVLLVGEIRADNKLFYKIPVVYIISMLSMFAFSQIGVGVKYEVGRLFMFGTNPNTLGFMSVFGAVFALNILVKQDMGIWGKAFYLAAFFLMVFLIGQTASRGAIYSLLAGILIYFFKLRRSLWQRIRIYIPAIFMMLLVILILFSTGVVRQRFVDESERQDFGSRKPIWEVSWALIKTKPVFGLGATAFDTETSKIIGRYRSQHNEYLRVMGYSGIVGLVLFLWFIIKLTRNVRKKPSSDRNDDKNLLYSLLGSTAVFLFVAGSILMTFLVWLVFAYSGSIMFLSEKKEESGPAKI
jgi:O-antigen ligase